MVSLHRVHPCTPPLSVDSPYFTLYSGTPAFSHFVKSSWQSRPRLRHCSRIPNQTRLQLPYTTSLRSCRAHVWIRLERMERRHRLASILHQRIGRRLRRKPRVILVSDIFVQIGVTWWLIDSSGNGGGLHSIPQRVGLGSKRRPRRSHQPIRGLSLGSRYVLASGRYSEHALDLCIFICIVTYTVSLLRLVWMGLCPMASDLFPSRKPNIVVSREMLDDSLQSHKTPWSTDPSSVEGNGDIRRFAFQPFLPDDTR
jgi:hypothetical protein